MYQKQIYDITEVCKMLGTTSRTLRFYEEKGIIQSTTVGTSSRRIVIYDKMYAEKMADGTTVENYFYPDDKVTLLPSGKLGDTWFGTTPEERTARQVSDADVSIYGTGIAIVVKPEYGPPAITGITASEITLPSYEGMDSTFVLEVHGE